MISKLLDWFLYSPSKKDLKQELNDMRRLYNEKNAQYVALKADHDNLKNDLVNLLVDNGITAE